MKHYFSLIIILSVGLTALFWFRYNHALQISVVIFMSAGYVAWGIIHHHSQKELHLKIVAEYLLIALVGILLLGSLLFRG